jgi:hypothetical protein
MFPLSYRRNMSRLSQGINYLNAEEVTKEDIDSKYTSIIITEELRKARIDIKRKEREEKRLLLLEFERL